MPVFTGLWVMQFGTIYQAAHGGFCALDVAAVDFNKVLLMDLWGDSA